MYDLETLLKDIKNPKHLALSALVCIFCMFLGNTRGSIGGLIVGIVVGIFLSLSGIILIYKHKERQKEIRDSLIIPKIGMTEKKEQWLRKKKLREVSRDFDIKNIHTQGMIAGGVFGRAIAYRVQQYGMSPSGKIRSSV